MSDKYLVIRLTPTSPVDGAAFATYLEGLTIKVSQEDASTSPPLLGSASYSSPLILIQEPGVSGSYLVCASYQTSTATPQTPQSSPPDYGNVLKFDSTTGIPIGAYLFFGSFAQSFFTADTTVTAVTKDTITLSKKLPKYVPASTIASFIWNFAPSPSDSPWSLNPPAMKLSGKTTTAAAKGDTVLKFASTAGISFGMSVSAQLAGVIDAGSTVTSADATSVTLSKPLLKTLPKDSEVDFQITLSSGIFQHVEPGTIDLGLSFPIVMPAAVATAIIKLNSPPPLLNIIVEAQRGTGSNPEQIPVEQAYYNVVVDTAALPTTPDEYQAIPSQLTSLYISLPPPPRSDSGFSVTLPSDGTAPKFDELSTAMMNVLAKDPTFTSAQSKTANAAAKGATVLDLASTAGIAFGMSVSTSLAGVIDTDTTVFAADATSVTLSKPILLALPKDTPVNFTYPINNLTTDQYRQIAYDIVWSQQNLLPAPPDPLESLYTNPPNTGGSGKDSTSGNNDEQDRQKFEGTLNSFYATKKALAERLTKYVAAVSTAIYCEKKSLAAAAAVLEFPVDPVDPSTQPAVAPAQVQTEVLLQGLSSSGINFGVPAAFFYALGANLDKSTSGDHRYQIATGDTIERILQEIGLAASAGVIQDSEPFSSNTALGAINSAQAARRLSALYTSAASSSPSVTLPATGPLDQVVQAWLDAPQPSVAGAPFYLSYKPELDGQIWWLISQSLPQGYLALVLAALTQGYIIPASGSNPAAPLADKIAAWLPSLTVPIPPTAANVQTLVQVSAQQWTAFFTPPLISDPTSLTAPDTTWLPPFTQPVTPAATQPSSTQRDGYITTRIRAFIRAVQKFFTVSSVVTRSLPPAPGSPSRFDPPSFDPISQVAQALLTGGSTFGSGPLTRAAVSAEVQVVAPDLDPAAQAWLVQAILTINELCQIVTTSAVGPFPSPTTTIVTPGLSFSVVEALYARGFRSAKDITDLSQDDFQQAMTGTVAYDYATSLYTAASQIAPSSASSTSSNGTFHPINPDGNLINCIPPSCLSPTGPVAYLQEMLRLSEASTCETPWPSEEGLLGDAIAARRGPLGNLLASCANLETPLPLIDIVNECLEYMSSVQSPTNGIVYDTSADAVAGHALCEERNCSKEGEDHTCHDPTTMYATLPEYSTPASPTPKNQSVEPLVFQKLKIDFSACSLPYSQALDVSRTYLRHLGTSRFEEMRTFRKCITEFVLDPAQEPTGFQSHLWRYPVRIDTAIEYLGITPEEYTLLFQGTKPRPCGKPEEDSVPQATSGVPAFELYGFASPGENNSWINTVVQLPEFLSRTCLDYCEFLDLQKSGFVTFVNGSFTEEARDVQPFPDCEPCCPETYTIQFVTPQDRRQALIQLAIFIRLWRKLREVDGARYSFDQLRDICEVLQLFKNDGTINPDFIRQLAAFQMLRDHLGLKLTDNTGQQPGATGADRTYLLALWAGTSAGKWKWAVQHLLDRVQHYARRQHQCGSRPPHFIKLLAENLDPLSLLAGFDPTSTIDTWHALPTHTLRFAEVLSKIYASDFSVGEILFLFTAGNHLDGDDPFPLPDDNEAFEFPLAFPDDEEAYSLRALRRKLLAVSVSREEAERWTWRHIESSLRHDFGYEPTASADPLLSIGEHFFPGVLSACGNHVDMKQRQYRFALADTGANATNPAMWNTPDSPFRYDTSTHELWIRLPLRDEEVFEKLSHIRQLNPDEQDAVQTLYFAPRVDLAAFAFIFSNFGAAVEHLIQEDDEEKRWSYFQHEFARCHARSFVIAEHLAHHVAAASGQEHPDGTKAWRLLQHLFADENRATGPWETDSGQVPAVTWQPQPNGGAFAALLGLTGTGLLGEFTPEGGSLVWNEMRGPMSAFGHEKNRWNIPVPTVLPAMNLTLSSAQAHFAGIRNGFSTKGQDGEPLASPQGFGVRWQGILLVEREGMYEFYAGSPTPEGERPNFEAAEQRRWRVTLKRGQKSWVVLGHHWSNTQAPSAHATPLALRSGAYQITVEFVQPEAVFTQAETCPQDTGFQVKYCGPDSEDHLITIPLDRLYLDEQNAPLGAGIDRGGAAEEFMSLHFTSSLRDMRRTYQRAFKALLFAHRFDLSAKPITEYEQSELGYMLAHPDLFEGTSYYRQGQNSGFGTHHAYFDFNFLPLLDNYRAPSPAEDQRMQPSPQRQQALFDWWERIFDYVQTRKETQHLREHPLWLLFEEAAEKQPDDAAQLLRHLGVDLDHADLTTRYYEGYNVTSTDLEDERWAIRAWRAEKWIRDLLSDLAAKDIHAARPDLWASDDPSALVPGEKETGNANLSAFLCDGSFENGEPRRYRDVKRLNDSLRERGRNALLQYLCRMNRVALPWQPGQFATDPHEISDLLLLDVQTGIGEKTSRIEEAITAVQTFIGRSRLGLEPGWTVSSAFAHLWDSRFETYRTWEQYKRRELYRDNWIEWDEFEKAQRIEAFRFLESELRSSTLTLAAPGGLAWWPNEYKPLEHRPELIQRTDPSELYPLSPPPSPWKTREGLDVLGTPEHAGQPTWLTSLQKGGANTNTPTPIPTPTSSTPQVVDSLVKATALSTALPVPLWMEAAMKMGTLFWRVAAAGLPQASLGFVPHDHEPDEVYCHECGHTHPAYVDEYYFWLIDARHFSIPDPNTSDNGYQGSYQMGFQDPFYDKVQQQSADWNDESQVPGLLLWLPKNAVRLAWCRVHNGEFGQPRKSEEVILTSDSILADLVFVGRAADSLFFSVNGGSIPNQDAYKDSSSPGFRYDIPSDSTVRLPQVIPMKKDPHITYPGGLPAYPFFAYNMPGERLFPKSLFSPALLVAEACRAQCSFELALKWYKRVFDPLQSDCTWLNCLDDATQGSDGATGSTGTTVQIVGVQSNPTEPTGGKVEVQADVTGGAVVSASASPATSAVTAPTALVQVEPNAARGTNGNRPDLAACCDSTKVSTQVAQNRSVTLHYCQTLLDWGDALMRRRRSPEAFQQARLIYDTVAKIMGKRPHSIFLEEPSSTQTVASFTPAFAPLNPRLLDLYDLVADRLKLIHASLDARRLHTGRLNHDMPYFGDDPLREGWRSAVEICAEETEWCYRHSPYRFVFLIQKAKEIAGQVRELGSALLSALEKGDAEYLASIRADHERELLALGLSIRQDQWRDADWQIQALQQTKDVNQTNLLYFSNLYQNGLINNEIQNQNLVTTAMQTRTSGNITEVIGEAIKIIPDLFIGFPCTDSQVPIGTKLAGVFETIAKVMFTVAEIQSATAAIDLTLAGWQRRSDEWYHQTQTLPIEIEQIELQILGAQRRRDQALRELNNQERQIEQASEVQDFLRDKFTAQDLYLFLQKETAALHSRMYELALFAARQAERAFNFERGYTSRRFIPDETWGMLHKGLLAGERLQFALSHMEKAYLDENVREYELTKHFSLRLHFPMAFLQLKTMGYCEIDIPEWMFDLDFPGQYMRRIKNVSLTIPCVTGPYTGVHCRLTLLSSMTRIDPRLTPQPDRCCCDDRRRNDYETCPHDVRFVRQYAATEAIATSSGQNDSGMFELNFRDERYLPFEFMGAVCRMRIELPMENNQFDFDTLSDVILHLNYTAREGGEVLRRAANELAQQHLPGAGVRYFDIRHEFPDAWHRLQGSLTREEASKHLGIRLSRDMFPFIPGHKELWVNRLDIFFEAPEAEPGQHKVVKFMVGQRDVQRHEDRDDREVHEITCVASEEWPDLYHGVLDIRMGPLAQRTDRDLGTFKFPPDMGMVSRAFLLCGYDVAQKQFDGKHMKPQWRK